jgi:hypothetical protein
MKYFRRKAAAGSLLLVLLGWLVWQFGPLQPVMAVASLSDPAKLATLGERGANARLNKIVYWLHEAKQKGLPPETAISVAQLLNRTGSPRAPLVKQSLTRNMKIAEGLGLFTRENLARLRHGKAAVVTRGPYAGSAVEIDHIVPYSLAREVGNELANLEMLPAPLNRRKSNRVGERQVAHAEKLCEAGLLAKESLERVRAQARRSGLKQASRP